MTLDQTGDFPRAVLERGQKTGVCTMMEQKKITAADIIRKFREMDVPGRRAEPNGRTQGSDRPSELASRFCYEPPRAMAK